MRNLYLGRNILALAAIYKWSEIINFIHDFVPLEPIYIKAALILIFVYYFANTLRASILKLLLSYHGWMFESPRKQSVTTKIWFVMMQIFKLRTPKTDDYQDYLPAQPVPKLKSTLDKYVKSYEGLMSPTELAKLANDAKVLAEKGSEIQTKLEQRSLIERHYNAGSWLKDHYLKYDGSLMKVNMFGADTLSPPTSSLTARAAAITSGYIEFSQLISSKRLKPMMLQNLIPMDMSQFKQLFSTTRIPGPDGDYLVTRSESDYIVVTHRNRWYAITIYNDKTIYNETEKKVLVNAKELEVAFDTIISDPRKASELELALPKMTAMPRKQWCEYRRRLMSDYDKYIDKIEGALLHVCLDDDATAKSDPSELSKQWLTGNGQRWFDKSITLHFVTNGYFGAGYDHTWGDGLATMYAYDFAIKRELDTIRYDGDLGKIDNVKMRVKIDILSLKFDGDFADGGKVGQYYTDLVAPVDVATFDVKYGKNQIKKLKTSPDAIIQFALQVAYYECYGRMPLTYEAAVTTMFDLGRTETIRTNSKEMSHVAKLVANMDTTDNKQISEKLDFCTRAHSQQSKEAMVGLGFDRHLFALSTEAKKQKLDLPLLDFYANEVFNLSTSMLPWAMSGIRLPKDYKILGGGFYYPWGIGVCYLPRDDYIAFTITTAKSGDQDARSADQFRDALHSAFDKIMSLY